MIVCHRHRYIFIKTNKTAGTSIEIALSRFCSNADVITPILPADELIRKTLDYRGPQNYIIPIRKYTANDYVSLLRGVRAKFYNHMPAREIALYVNEETWKSYYKFCFERHPYDRVVSLYFWRFKEEPRPPISHFLAQGGLQFLKTRGIDLYTVDGKVVVDKVYKYEDMTSALADIAERLGFEDEITLPSAKASTRPLGSDYRTLLRTEDKEMIRSAFGDEASLLGYEL